MSISSNTSRIDGVGTLGLWWGRRVPVDGVRPHAIAATLASWRAAGSAPGRTRRLSAELPGKCRHREISLYASTPRRDPFLEVARSGTPTGRLRVVRLRGAGTARPRLPERAARSGRRPCRTRTASCVSATPRTPTLCLEESLVSLQAASRLFTAARRALELVASSAPRRGLWLNKPVR